MNIERYDIEAGRNVLNMLKKVSPGDYAILMTKLKTQAGMAGLSASNTTEENTSGFWSRLFEAGGTALNTIADYKMQEQTSKAQQKQYEEAVETEMQRQAMLAAQRQSQALEYQNQMEFARQRQELEVASSRAKGQMTNAFIAVGALLGIWVLYRVIA